MKIDTLRYNFRLVGSAADTQGRPFSFQFEMTLDKKVYQASVKLKHYTEEKRYILDYLYIREPENAEFEYQIENELIPFFEDYLKEIYTMKLNTEFSFADFYTEE